VRNSAKAASNWIKTSVLILDEVSMLSADMMDLLDLVGRQMRPNYAHRPFGGVQLIM